MHRRRDDEIGLANGPLVAIGELARRREIGRVPVWRAAVHPRRDHGDFMIAQRRIVLETLDADVLLNEPGWHLSQARLQFDAPGPRAYFLVGEQRHRRDGPWPMAVLTR